MVSDGTFESFLGAFVELLLSCGRMEVGTVVLGALIVLTESCFILVVDAFIELKFVSFNILTLFSLWLIMTLHSDFGTLFSSNSIVLLLMIATSSVFTSLFLIVLPILLVSLLLLI